MSQLPIIAHGDRAAVVLPAEVLAAPGVRVGDVPEASVADRQLVLHPAASDDRRRRIEQITAEVYEQRREAYRRLAQRGRPLRPTMKPLHCLLAVALGAGLVGWLVLARAERRYAVQPYSLVEDRLYVGGLVANPPPGTGAVVSLCHVEDRYAVEHALWEPFDGSEAPSIDWLRRVVRFIDEQRNAGRTVYVHCMAGMNRSGMVVTAYLMHEHGWGRDEALAFVQSKRPQVQPNPELMRLLAEWERVLAAERRAE